MIGGFRSDLSIIREADGNPRVFCFPKSRINENGGKGRGFLSEIRIKPLKETDRGLVPSCFTSERDHVKTLPNENTVVNGRTLESKNQIASL